MTSESRRKAAKNILVGGGIIGGAVAGQKWVKPVMKKTVLPAHANLSPSTW